MPALKPKVVGISAIKQKLLKPALSNHFALYIADDIPGAGNYDQEKLLLSCCEASLPGSQLQSYDDNDKFHGYTQHYAYARQFDGSIDCGFYVDAPYGSTGYTVITVFENWMNFIANPTAPGTPYASSRVKYPDEYMKTIYITKFEKDYDFNSSQQCKVKPIRGGNHSGYLEYEFIDVYPISISSMPVSYDGQSLLKCNVTFSYNHYVPRFKGGSSSQYGSESNGGSNFWSPENLRSFGSIKDKIGKNNSSFYSNLNNYAYSGSTNPVFSDIDYSRVSVDEKILKGQNFGDVSNYFNLR